MWWFFFLFCHSYGSGNWWVEQIIPSFPSINVITVFYAHTFRLFCISLPSNMSPPMAVNPIVRARGRCRRWAAMTPMFRLIINRRDDLRQLFPQNRETQTLLRVVSHASVECLLTRSHRWFKTSRAKRGKMDEPVKDELHIIKVLMMMMAACLVWAGVEWDKGKRWRSEKKIVLCLAAACGIIFYYQSVL